MADQPNKKIKRRVKSPETFRERAAKASQAAGQPAKPAKLKRTRQAVVKVGGRPFRPVSRALGGLFALKPFVVTGRVLKRIGKFVFPVYFYRSWRELRLVDWPGWRESRRLTFAVLVFAVVFGAIIAGVDYGLDKVFRNILLK